MIVLALLLAAQTADLARTTPATSVAVQSNSEIKALFDADQAARENLTATDYAALYRADAGRRKRTKALLDAGQLRTADDFYHAAFILQHGNTPGDYLLAHTLAVASVAAGRKDAQWIAAATLDRYLQEIHQPQIYGTQYNTPFEGVPTQEPYDRELIPDSLRTVLGVPTRAEQEKRRAEIEARVRANQSKR